jgi:hypothetical protein
MAESIVDRLLGQSAEKWKAVEAVPERDLLRLSILRGLVNELHAQKSRYLSQGKRNEAGSIRGVESKIDELRGAKSLSGELGELMSSENKIVKRTRVLPDSLFSALEREKLERYDRQWEAALASEALSLGWKVWSLEASVEIPKVEEWNRLLVEQLWPDGVVLFVESAGQPGTTPVWHGRWITVLHPKFKKAEDISFNLSLLPGNQSPPLWRVLFSPKSS